MWRDRFLMPGGSLQSEYLCLLGMRPRVCSESGFGAHSVQTRMTLRSERGACRGRGASFVDGCEATRDQGAVVSRGHFCDGVGAVSLLKASEAAWMGMP